MAGGGGEGGDYDVNINLTALLDVLTNLLFFLMVGFAAQQVSMEAKAGIVLPNSTAELVPKKNFKVMVGKFELSIENEAVATIKDGKVTNAGDNPAKRIEPLYLRLVRLREDKAADEFDTKDALWILADRDTPYSLLRRVLTTSGEAGFPKFRMAVIMK